MNLVLLAIPATLAVIVVALLSYGIVFEEEIILYRLCSDAARAAMTDAGDVLNRPDAVPKELAASNNRFAMDFYRQVSGDENVLFSPASMYVAFSSLYEGAGHDAARELEGAFGFEPDLESRYLDTAHLLAFLKTDYRDAGILMANRFADISMANGFWIPEHATPMADAYAYTVRALYMGKIGSVPAGESGSKIINDWMAKQTSGRAAETLEPLGPDASLVVAGTATFDAPWAVQFPPENTRHADFDTGSGTVTVDMVKTTATLRYADTGAEQVLQMPYDGAFGPMSCRWLYVNDGTPKYLCNWTSHSWFHYGQPAGHSLNSDISGACGLTGDSNRASTNSWIHPGTAAPAFAQYLYKPPVPNDDWFSMLVVLPPHKPGGMHSLEERLSTELFEEWRSQLRHAKVDVTLPKFESEGRYDLVPILEGLGVKKIGDAGSLPGISKYRHVSDAIHYAHVQVDKNEGKRPITTPDPEVAESVQQQHPYSFVADRPFLYFIQDNRSGAIIFMGKVTDPTA